ncbi:hypothetical protein pipiens_015794 [Culex pipiens pipiens]|uniref:C2H2-type domain-containing protein n=1 Tax=Culex pipiens pipiens TaxID=38569 RepID=A0ABD1CP03_CULPP
MATAQVKPEPLEELDPEQEQNVGIGYGNREFGMENSTGHCVTEDRRKEAISENDPLLQETINALMIGAGGIEVVTGTAGGGTDEADRNYVHNDERPFKCASCDKAFREQYRLTKHLRTHEKDQPETEHSQDASLPSTSAGQTTAEDEDYATGDSERFFKSYELQEGSAALKLEPDISITVDGANVPSTTSATTVQTSASEQDVRYQIIEERIKSLQREVHLVNSNLSRVESKLDGLTKIIAIFINKFDEVDSQSQETTPTPIAPATTTTNGSKIIPLLSIPVEALPVAPTPPTPPAPIIQMITHHHPMVTEQQPPVQIPVPVQQQQHHQPPANTFVQCDGSNSWNTSSSSTSNINKNDDTFPEVPELPIRTVNDFLDLNDHCSDNEQFLLQMMIRLHQEVDQSQPHQRNVKKMMEALVTYEVLCQFSWSGKSAINGQYTKYVFGNSVGIIDLLTKTLNLGRSTEEAQANQKPILTAIQSFIKHSRQNMLRDSRKRRESGGVYPPEPRPMKQRSSGAEPDNGVNQF